MDDKFMNDYQKWTAEEFGFQYNPKTKESVFSECLEEMELIWDKEALLQWCLISAYFHRYKAMMLRNSEDISVAKFYLEKAIDLKIGIENEQ